jgi:hypothetical protein
MQIFLRIIGKKGIVNTSYDLVEKTHRILQLDPVSPSDGVEEAGAVRWRVVLSLGKSALALS